MLSEGLDQLRVPELKSGYPLKRSRLYDDARRKARDDWFLSYGLVPASRQEKFRLMDWTYLGAVYCPASPAGRLDVLIDLLATWTLQDDSWSRESDSFTHRSSLIDGALCSLNSGFTAGTDPFEPMYRDIWSRLADRIPARQLDRLTDAVGDWLIGCRAQAARQSQPTPCSLQEYLALRLRDIGQKQCGILIEISLCMDLSPEDLIHPAVERLQRADAYQTVLCNDLLSAKKELRDGQSWNAICCLTDTGSSREEALEILHDMYRGAINDFSGACRALEADHRPAGIPLGDRASALRYVQGLRDGAAGMAECIGHSARYTGSPANVWSSPACWAEQTSTTR